MKKCYTTTAKPASSRFGVDGVPSIRGRGTSSRVRAKAGAKGPPVPPNHRGTDANRIGWTRRSHIALCFVWTLFVPIAVAADEPSAWRTRQWALEGHLGFGTPVGYFGAVLDYSPLEVLSVNAGIGMGSGRGHGTLHIAGGVRVRLGPLGTAQLYLATEYSTGGFSSFNPVPQVHGSSETVVFASRLHWLQPSVGVEWRSRTGLAGRLYCGAGFMLNPGDRQCLFIVDGEDIPCGEDVMGASGIGFLGGALGYAF
jgi:hypothetical protein